MENEEKSINLHEKAQYKNLDQDQLNDVSYVREAFSEMYKAVEYLDGSAREKALAMTKLEEAQFWIIKSISRR